MKVSVLFLAVVGICGLMGGVTGASQPLITPVNDTATPIGTDTSGVLNSTTEPIQTLTPELSDETDTVTNTTSGQAACTQTEGVDSVEPTIDNACSTVESLTTPVVEQLHTGIDNTSSATRSPTSTNGSGAEVVPQPPEGGLGSDRGGGLSGAAGGVVTLGVVTGIGAGLLHRSTDGIEILTRTTAQFARGHPANQLRNLSLWGQEWIRWLVGIAGYSRYDDTDPLENETRAELYRLIKTTPGMYQSSLAEESGIPNSTARHHLRILESENLVTNAMIRGRRRYFPIGTDEHELEAALADETQAVVLQRIANRGSVTVSMLAEDLDLDASTISYHLTRLEEADLITRHQEGRRVWSQLSDHISPYFEEPAVSTGTD